MESRFGRSLNTALNAAAIPFALVAVIAVTALLLSPGPSSSGSQNSDDIAAASGQENTPEPSLASGARCPGCGVIESIREIRQEAQRQAAPSGNRLDRGALRAVSTFASSVLSIEEPQSTARYEITVRMKDGSSRVVSEPDAGVWRQGKRVILIDGSSEGSGTKLSRADHRPLSGEADAPPLSISAVQLQRK